MDHDLEHEDDLPEARVDDLRAAFRAEDEPPAAVDAEIRAAARDQAAAIRTSRRGGRPWWIGVAAAAAVLVVFVGLRVLGRGGDAEPETAPLVANLGPADDVTVLDAFRLARLLRDEETGLDAAGWDVDANGLVDAADVDLLLDRAVSLGGV